MTFSDGLQCSRKQKAQDFSGYNIHLYPDIILTNTVAKRTSEFRSKPNKMTHARKQPPLEISSTFTG